MAGAVSQTIAPQSLLQRIRNSVALLFVEDLLNKYCAFHLLFVSKRVKSYQYPKHPKHN